MNSGAVSQLDQQYAYIDYLPGRLFDRVVITRGGTLQLRVKGILYWRDCLLEGSLPNAEKSEWPSNEISRKIIKRIDGLELASSCKGVEDLTDKVLIEICNAVDRYLEHTELGVEGLFDDPLNQNRRRRTTPTQMDREDEVYSDTIPPARGAEDSARGVSGSEGNQLPGDGINALDSIISDETSSSPVQLPNSDFDLIDAFNESAWLDAMTSQWDDALSQWQLLEAVASGLAIKPGRGWDLSRGDLVKSGLELALQLQSWMVGRDDLSAVVHGMGRSRNSDEQVQAENTAVDECIEESRAGVELLSKPVPMSSDGICRSDDLTRMLPQEAVLLGHKNLRMLWHVKRSERALMSYQVRGVLPQVISSQPWPESDESSIEKEDGPIIVCLDTSASMSGLPEQTAKALVLEVLRLAGSWNRRAVLVCFSGPGQITSIEMGFDRSSFTTLSYFLKEQFQGGTDVYSVISFALKMVENGAYRNADILLVSDGRFPMLNRSDLADTGLGNNASAIRIHGLLVGQWMENSMRALCKPLYRYNNNQVILV